MQTLWLSLPQGEQNKGSLSLFCFLKNIDSVQSSSESNHIECSAVISVSSSIIFGFPIPKWEKSGSTQALKIEILLKKMKQSGMKQIMRFSWFRKSSTVSQKKKKYTVAENTQKNRCYQNDDFMEETQETTDIPLLHRFPGQHMPSLWQRFFFLRHIIHADVA